MTSLAMNLVKRVDRLPKPGSASGAMQPLFEAVSNAIHSTQERFRAGVSSRGRINIEVNITRDKSNVTMSVADNGVGLNEKHYDAFVTTDTDNKISIGGKGVGRLLWLDCFQDITITSVYEKDGRLRRRSFKFQLSATDQITNEHDQLETSQSADTGFIVKFNGLRNNGYLDKFPGRATFVFQHFMSHFLPTFIGGKSPIITVTCGSESKEFPDAIKDIVYRQEAVEQETKEYGKLTLTLMECNKTASSDLSGKHFIHFIAHDRTVHSQNIDGRLGIKYFGPDGDRTFHACLLGQFLNKNVNQERTRFIFDDATIEGIVNDVCMPHVEKFLVGPMTAQKKEQARIVEEIVGTYPSVKFGSISELQEYVPSGELAEDAVYGHLARQRFRRDQKQAEKIKTALSRLKGETLDAETFGNTVHDASKAIEDAKQRSLAEYIVRRKVVLDFLGLLLEKVRQAGKDAVYQSESVLHTFICPMRIATAGRKKGEIEPASHDLWVVDERLTFAEYFSSDVSFSELTDQFRSKDRPDIVVFDHVHGLWEAAEASKVLLVEFKRPGRTKYKADENPQQQVERYVRTLQEGQKFDVGGRPIKCNSDTVFYCYIVADCVGLMDEWTYSWGRTADGRGRIYQPSSGFRGSIELIGWDALLSDAQARNKAFFERAGISKRNFFSNS